MKRLVALKIDVTKIDKKRLFKGEKATYLDAVVFLDDEPGKYGDNGMITQSVSKEERESGVRGEILGNAKILKVMDDGGSNRATSQSSSDGEYNLPF